jgi:hypothetical protein
MAAQFRRRLAGRFSNSARKVSSYVAALVTWTSDQSVKPTSKHYLGGRFCVGLGLLGLLALLFFLESHMQ